MRRVRAWTPGARAWLLACLGVLFPGTPALAITNGTPDSSDSAVVAVEPIACSGTLISPRVVLTAAHCAWQQPLGALSVFFGADVSGAGRRLGVLEARVHPAWDPAADENDLAVLMLSEPVSDVAPATLLDRPMNDGLLGARLRIVGFGVDAAGNPASLGVKREGGTTLSAYLATTLVDDSTPSSTCNGDSGGPAFLGIAGTEYLAGVTSRGDEGCQRFGVKTRVDASLADFLLPYVNASQAGGARTGDRCAYDSQCAAGVCVTASDNAGIHFCSAPCGRNTDCPAAMVCSRQLCRYPLPTPGSFGSACDRDSNCEGWLCAARDPGEPRICSVACIASAQRPCARGYACLPRDGRPSETVCLPDKATGGGCSAGGPGAGGLSCGLSLLLLGLGHRRRVARRGPRTRERPLTP